MLDFTGDREDSRLYSPEGLVLKRNLLLDRLQGGPLRVVVPVGHGATTLARWVVKRVEQDCLRMRMIPVLVSLDDLLDNDHALAKLEEIHESSSGVVLLPPPVVPDYTQSSPYIQLAKDMRPLARRKRIKEAMVHVDEITRAALDHVLPQAVLDDAIHAAVVRSLVTHPWERVIGDYRYGTLIGAAETDGASLRKRRGELQPIADPAAGSIDWGALSVMSKILGDRGELAQVLSKNRIQVVVNLDLSCTHYGRLTVREAERGASHDIETNWFKAFAVERFLTHLKDQDDQTGDLMSTWKAAGDSVVSVTEFLSAGTNAAFQALYATAHGTMETTAFDPLDVFAVVAAHYPQKRTNSDRPELVSAVMSTGVIEGVARSPLLALTSMVHELEDVLTSWDSFTYHAQWPEFRDLPEQVQALEEKVVGMSQRIETVEQRVDTIEGLGRSDGVQ